MKTLKTVFNVNSKDTFDHIVIKGDPFARGSEYGLQCKERIVENLKFYKKSFNCLDWNDIQEFVNHNYMKALENYFPTALTEMKGLAFGAGVSLTDIIAINARYELLQWNNSLSHITDQQQIPDPCECTSGVCLSRATKSGNVLIGQNLDNNKRLLFEDMAVLLEVHPSPTENISPFFTLTEVGQLANVAMSSTGLGITGLSLFSSADHFGIDSVTGYLPTSLLIRLFIESPNFAVGLKRLLSVPRHSSVNITAVSSEGEGEAVNFEMTPNQYFTSYPSIETNLLTHSNRFKSQEFQSNNRTKDRHISVSSLFRDRQLERHLMAKCGSIDDKYFENAFKNHFSYPDSLCRHLPEKGKEEISTNPDMCTIANMICNLSTKTVKLCRGQPCTGVYKEYRFNNNKEKN